MEKTCYNCEHRNYMRLFCALHSSLPRARTCGDWRAHKIILPETTHEDIEEILRTKVEVPRTRNGTEQTLETLINEEALLLAKYLRNEKKNWVPRITINFN
jgi:hypothetical protein